MTSLRSSRLLLRAVQESDLNTTYLGWLNDSMVNRFLETRYLPQSLEALHSYWLANRDNPRSPWFAICLQSDGRHIGNIKIGPIDWIHRRADISLFIGDKSCWGKGFGVEAISAIRDWAFMELDLYKLKAGIYAGNIGSRRAFEKSGFLLESILSAELYYRGQREDLWLMGFPRHMWKPPE